MSSNETMIRAIAGDRLDALEAERDALLRDWNALVAAIGAPTNGGAVGHAAALKADRDRLAAELAKLSDKYELAILDLQAIANPHAKAGRDQLTFFAFMSLVRLGESSTSERTAPSAGDRNV